MLLKRERLVEGDARVADSCRVMNRGSIQIAREMDRQASLVVSAMGSNSVLSGFI